MSGKLPALSGGFQAFLREAPGHAQTWMEPVRQLGKVSALGQKTESLAYLAALAVPGLDSGVPFHVGLAKAAGASRKEAIGAVLVGLPAAGNIVTRSLPAAPKAHDAAPGK